MASKKIALGIYDDLPSFADYLAYELNQAVGNKPLPDPHQVGIHVTGFHPWKDGVKRPVFYHIHNGHSVVVFHQRFIKDEGRYVISPEWKREPRELFRRYDDFSPETKTPGDLTSTGYLTTNGDFATFQLLLKELTPSFLQR